ncbi:hypothetical protein ACFY05_33025 [Microtetraspora fusca]|uniref:Uncharacterized protein n=1 Tax=Microtetraspora fusca TaxID=1997 RepID=A0ABW6VGE7_MICFU
MNDQLKEFRDKLLDVVQDMDGVASAGAVEHPTDVVIGVELNNGEDIFLQIVPA